MHGIAAALAILCLLSPRRAAAQDEQYSSTLNDAFALLSQAPAIYKGHRGMAMQELRRAAALSGEHVSAKTQREKLFQSKSRVRKQDLTVLDSDEKLRSAQTILTRMRYRLSGNTAVHVDKALAEINTALTARDEASALQVRR